MGLYKNFKIASYAHAQYLVSAAEEDIVRQIDYFDAYLGGLDKIYLERSGENTGFPKRRLKDLLKSLRREESRLRAALPQPRIWMMRLSTGYLMCTAIPGIISGRTEKKKSGRRRSCLMNSFWTISFSPAADVKECIRKKGTEAGRNTAWS